MRVIIAGSRTITSYMTVFMAIQESNFVISEVVSGGAQGVDSMGELYASEQGLPLTRMPAKWHLYGKRAGPIRNQAMALYADALIAVWDGKSYGTKDMIKQATDYGLEVYVHVVR